MYRAGTAAERAGIRGEAAEFGGVALSVNDGDPPPFARSTENGRQVRYSSLEFGIFERGTFHEGKEVGGIRYGARSCERSSPNPLDFRACEIPDEKADYCLSRSRRSPLKGEVGMTQQVESTIAPLVLCK